MTPHRLNAAFLTPEDLEAIGVFRAKERNILVHSTAVIRDVDAIEFGENIRIDPFVVISCNQLILGDNIHLATGCGIFGAARISIGDFANVSGKVFIYSSSDDYSGKTMTNPTVPIQFTGVQHGEVSIGRHAIVGAGSIILPGSTLGEGVAIGCSSLVNGAIAPWTISAGVPAKKIRNRERKLLEHETAYFNSKKL